ncbi:hypothetical protein FNW25_02135 [Flavobacterium franklandianum]|uniref:hypothetical protein n=1 Tax=Flavobacterium franklandianum TaxID=2594430 RepID=UPI00117AF845|nr:hypothetical protein [Flavobacterium franklandianum]TRX29326.1 hypothetical protein FNW25_02135 [Flavobacterium franklandianum]
MSKEPFAAKLTSIWIGDFFFWIIKGFRGKLIEQFEKEYESRNVWTGFFITLISVSLIVYFLVIY